MKSKTCTQIDEKEHIFFSLVLLISAFFPLPSCSLVRFAWERVFRERTNYCKRLNAAAAARTQPRRRLVRL